MVTTQTRVETTRASRYLVQLCRHANEMGGSRIHRMRHGAAMPQRPEQVSAEWSDTNGTITLTPWGRCTLTATADALELHVEATDPENLRNVQTLLAANLTRFGRRDQLAVHWPDDSPATPRGHRRAITLVTTGALGVAVLVAVHLGVGGGAVALSRWLGWTGAGLVLTPILLVAAHAAIPVLALRLRRPSPPPK